MNYNYSVCTHSASAGDRYRNQAYLPGTGDLQSEAFPLHFSLADLFKHYTLLPGTHMFDRTSFSGYVIIIET